MPALALLTTSDIRWRPALDSPGPIAPTVVEAAIEVLPLVVDDSVADVIERLANEALNLREELAAVRLVLAESLGQLYRQVSENRRLQRRLVELLELREEHLQKQRQGQAQAPAQQQGQTQPQEQYQLLRKTPTSRTTADPASTAGQGQPQAP